MPLRRIVYVPLESYESRYTFQLRKWTTKQLKDMQISFEVVDGMSLRSEKQILLGQVLDAYNRPYYALSQTQHLVKMASENMFSDEDFILFEDMFHPGIEALGYIFDNLLHENKYNLVPKIGMRCLAQTIDPDDFVHYTNNMCRWMEHYDKMVCNFVTCLFFASKEMLGYFTAAHWPSLPIEVTGLPFCKEEVSSWIQSKTPFEERSKRIVFASRIADEKQPEFLANFAVEARNRIKGLEPIRILSGSNINPDKLSRYPLLAKAISDGHVIIRDDLKKLEYYRELDEARVLFNCSFQDWVSNTGSEADTLGCNLLFPAYRSFPEAFEDDHTRMYVPWSIEDAVLKLEKLIEEPVNQGQFSDKQNGTNARTISYIKKCFENLDRYKLSINRNENKEYVTQ